MENHIKSDKRHLAAERTAQFDTLRLRLIKIAARVDELKKRIRVRLPTACPDQPILRLCVERLTRLRLLT
jgi:hypothetical protein